MIRKYILPLIWISLIAFLAIVSLRYRSRTEAMVALVESQVTGISYAKPVVIQSINVVTGQEVSKGDTLLIVSRPDLALEIDKKENELERLDSELVQTEQEYSSKVALLEIETEGKINRLNVDLAELKTELSQKGTMLKNLREIGTEAGGQSHSDSLMKMKILSLKQEITEVKSYAKKEKERLTISASDKKALIRSEITILNKELISLQEEYGSLIKTATFDGIIGAVGVQLDELVPPFKSVLTLYELKPTLIKAFMNESISYPVNSGTEVRVVSENRLYSVNGVVLELGARITDYPEKIQPNQSVKSYGQEVFIKIPSENRFLNGEKVFVYPKEVE